MGQGRDQGADVVLRLPPGWTSDDALRLRGPRGVRLSISVRPVSDDVGLDAVAADEALLLRAAAPDLVEVEGRAAPSAAASLAGAPAYRRRLARTPPDGPAEAWLHVVAVLDGRAWTVTAVADAATAATDPRLLEDAVAAVLGSSPSSSGLRESLVGRLRRGVARTQRPGADRRVPEAHAAGPETEAPIEAAEERADDGALLDEVRTLLERAAEAVVDDESLRAATSGAEFEEAVALLTASRLPDARLLHEASRDSWFPACAKLAAVARRPRNPGLVDAVLGRLDRHAPVELPFLLGVLEAHADGPLVERILVAGPGSAESPFGAAAVHELVTARLAAGEEPDPARLLDLLGDAAPPWLPAVLEDLRFVLPDSFVVPVEAGLRRRAARRLLRDVGRLEERPGAVPDQATVLVTGERAAALQDLEAGLAAEPPRSTLVIGPSGSGRSTVIAMLARRLRAAGTTVFEARAADVVAGQKYVGELEERVGALGAALETEGAVWVLPSFADAYWAGRHHDSPRGLLDLVLPQVASGRIRIVGELDAGQYERLAGLRPSLRAAFDTVTIQPLGPEESLEVARRWVGRLDGQSPDAWEGVLREALQLADHYLREERLPGSLLRLLDGARALATADPQRAGPPAPEDLLAVVSTRTGVPLDLLDDRRPLDLDALRAFFARRVVGQDEAVTALVDRVAMIKAGLTDPTRPQGVFLFVGPTGTGKTEIAKALAERLFGSPDRLLRLDMSEFQTADSLVRLTGAAGPGESGEALVDQIRARPFSVVLLDEVEKAHPRVWDLFLQVFDDGRLTDATGRTADFRHCLVVMTSNLGAEIGAGGVGFAGDAGPTFSPAGVRRAVEGAFRPEFLNRLDRVVVFRPLARETMRQIIHRELEKLLDRRGLRTRAWAIEWDPSAIEFLLERGFSPDLGARPLTRAIDQHLLAPLSRTIVGRRYPEGDQFLFVRSPDGAALDVVFVDPDADEATAAPPGAAVSAGLRASALDPRGTAAEWGALEGHLARLGARMADEDWGRRKAEALRRTADPGFWERSDRFATLGFGEYVDRLEAGLRGAESLLRRGTGRAARGRGGLPAELQGQLAARLLLLEQALDGLEAGAPRDAFLRVRPGRPDDGRAQAFADRVETMYRHWARRRGMSLRVLTTGGEAGAAPPILAVSGFAAHAVLAPEAGLHVLEEPRAADGFDRVTAHVAVAPQPDEPVPAAPADARAVAEAAVASVRAVETVVRRYRERPSPLVRDAVRGWRTGRLDRVLDGDFDLFE